MSNLSKWWTLFVISILSSEVSLMQIVQREKWIVRCTNYNQHSGVKMIKLAWVLCFLFCRKVMHVTWDLSLVEIFHPSLYSCCWHCHLINLKMELSGLILACPGRSSWIKRNWRSLPNKSCHAIWIIYLLLNFNSVMFLGFSWCSNYNFYITVSDIEFLCNVVTFNWLWHT